MSGEISYQMVEEEDTQAVKALWQYCFDDEERFVAWYFAHYYQARHTLGAYRGSDLVGATQMIPYQIALRGVSIPVGYIVGVSTAPEARRSGIGRGMLVGALTAMRERGENLGLLMPFEGSFYYPYQWRFCYFQHQYSLAITELNALRKPYGQMKRVDPWAHIFVLSGIYQGFMRGKNGYVLRSEENWRNLIGDWQLDNCFCYLLMKQGVAEGYVFYYFAGEKLVIREMAYLHYMARCGLLDFIYGHRSHKCLVEWSAAVDDGAEFLFAKTKTGGVVYPFLMARIVDVRGLLTEMVYGADVPSMKIDIVDPLLKWNNGLFDFSVTNGQGQVSLCINQGDWDLQIGIESLTQLVMGAVDCSALRYQQLLAVANEEAFARLEALWPKMVNYINEHY